MLFHFLFKQRRKGSVSPPLPPSPPLHSPEEVLVEVEVTARTSHTLSIVCPSAESARLRWVYHLS